uniref:Protein S100 n=2 Tax=Gopherus TaxID=38771 RepID=A0A8C4VRQ1_9SAUR
MLTPLEGAVGIIVEIFHKYSCNEPHHDKLSKAELKCLIQKELGNILQVTIFDDLDVNKDQEINFKEYMILITTLLLCVHDKLHSN